MRFGKGMPLTQSGCQAALTEHSGIKHASKFNLGLVLAEELNVFQSKINKNCSYLHVL
jgi:hypothetical protein